MWLLKTDYNHLQLNQIVSLCVEQKELGSEAPFNLECLKRKSRMHCRAPAGVRPASSWGLSRILHTVQQNWTWMLTFKSTVCALRLLSYYEYLIKKKKKSKGKEKNPLDYELEDQNFYFRVHHLLPTSLWMSPFRAPSLHFFICKIAIPALLPTQGSLEHLKLGVWKHFVK